LLPPSSGHPAGRKKAIVEGRKERKKIGRRKGNANKREKRKDSKPSQREINRRKLDFVSGT
jgi:hypothetical protein